MKFLLVENEVFMVIDFSCFGVFNLDVERFRCIMVFIFLREVGDYVEFDMENIFV